MEKNTVISACAQKRGEEYALALSELAPCLPTPQSIEAEAEARELAKAIDRWLTGLPADDRVLFIRRYRMGDSIATLADATGLKGTKVSKKLHSLREKLRKYLVKEKFLQ